MALLLVGASHAPAQAPAPTPPRLDVGGEVRPFFEAFRNEEWGDTGVRDDRYGLLRLMVRADAHVSDRLRVKVELKSGLIGGREGPARVPDEDQLDLHQAFADVRLGRGWAVIVGRQELAYGSSRLVAVREGPNVRQSFDGVRLAWASAGWQVDAFWTRPVETDPGVFDDGTNDARGLWGVYAVRHRNRGRSGVDAYYLGARRRIAGYEQGRGRERRHSVGTRWWRRPGPGALDYNFEGVWQGGSFGAGRIRAWTVASDTGYTFGADGLVRAGLRADVTSGDADPRDPDLQTFNAMYPKGAYFGLIAPTGPSNHRDVHPQVTARIGPRIEATLDWLVLWRHSLRDGLYDIPGALLRAGATSDTRFVGHQPGLEVTVDLAPRTTATFNVATFVPGPFLRDTGHARHIGYFASWVTYRF
ncbi:alginate export family protein [Luteitalea sp. TBR-22]|uniref:alginate export family protein n=1 Tax=Luteitalea sp. TBR-22 TaxID=2802971 RepID=UPI001AF3BB5C|nr:alginate export family protein [Luteitalea sp. TBR-22]BCS32605.1 alginate export family protein [Luteitalea sp. TBR-22]